MKAKQSNEMTAIKKKLMAAIAMLLVACIMTVSSTYAWFTLSTAPEVKGITTTVGANGNLEIALGTYKTVYGGEDVTSGENDSMDIMGKNKHESNITWGNLIDLDDATYGLSKITLYPSRLNATAAGLDVNSPLSFPVYGADGRVTELNPSTMVGKYDVNSNGFMALTNPDYAGVNGIGSVSDMTPREFAVRNTKNAISSYRLAAVADAKGALAMYSGELAALALKHQESTGEESVSAEEVAVLRALITKLENSNQAISDSLKSAVLLVLASSSVEDTVWANTVEEIEEKNITETMSYIGGLADLSGLSIPSQVTDIVSKYETIAGKLTTAKGKLPSDNSASTWGSVKDAVSALLVASDIKISGYTIEQIKASKAGTDKTVFNDVLSKGMSGQLEFQFGANSGIFADIADVVGAYQSTITFPEGVSVESIPLSTLGSKPVLVESRNSNSATGDLGTIRQSLDGMKAPDGDPNAAKALTDTYGYSIDLIFRTNATDSYLELQTAAKDRIYGENKNEALMGGGSNMTFTIDGEYTKAKIDSLAAGIRVVFYDTTSTNHEILGVAILDTATGNVSGSDYKLDLKLAKYAIVDGKMDVDDGFLTDDNGTTTIDESATLTALAANVEKKITALVYLDGDVIDNADVGALGSLNGKLNLQFASSAALKPMDNNVLMNG